MCVNLIHITHTAPAPPTTPPFHTDNGGEILAGKNPIGTRKCTKLQEQQHVCCVCMYNISPHPRPPPPSHPRQWRKERFCCSWISLGKAT